MDNYSDRLVTLIGTDAHQFRDFVNRTPSPILSFGRKVMPALTRALSTAETVLILGSTSSRSRRVTALSDTMALSARSCWDQRSRARAARIWDDETMEVTIAVQRLFAT